MKLGYRPELDGLRALAALSVLAWHDWFRWASGGSLGVDVFFVLSGYLITSIIWREIQAHGSVDYRRFFARRARRLLPALLTMLTVYVAVAPFITPIEGASVWSDTLIAGLYLTNIVQAFRTHDSGLMHTWSLAGEVQFYLAFPFVLAWAAHFGARLVGAGMLLAWAALTGVRLIWTWSGGDVWVAYYLPLFHGTGLVLGAAIALLAPSIRLGRAGLAGVIALFIVGGTRFANTHHYVVPLAEIAAVLVVLDPPRLLAWKPLELVGRISYGIYLWHLPLFFALRSAFSGPPPVLLLAGLAIGAATLSYVLVERRFMGRTVQSAEAAAAA